MTGHEISHAHAVSAVIGIVAAESSLSSAERLIDKLWGADEEPLTSQERHDLASILFATQQACQPINPAAMVHKAVRLDSLLEKWADVFGGQL